MVRIEVNNLTLHRGGKAVLRNLSFTLESGEITVIAGGNGTGKSTLLRALAGLDGRAGRSITFDGAPLSGLSAGALAEIRAFLPQSGELPEGMSVAQAVALGRYPHRKKFAPLSRRDREVCAAALEELGIAKLAERKVETLSGGEKRKVRLAMCAAQEPELLILDEPATFLDPPARLELAGFIQRRNREKGVTVLIAEHDLNRAVRIAHAAVVLGNGEATRLKTPAELLSPETLAKFFGLTAVPFIAPDELPFLTV